MALFVSLQPALSTLVLTNSSFIRTKIESLVSASLSGNPLDRETSAWLGQIGDQLHSKLATAGLIPHRQRQTLCELFERFMANKSVKEATLITYRAVIQFAMKPLLYLRQHSRWRNAFGGTHF